ncbi:M20 family peptidase [Hymenobacter coccineus]|uniref:Carboxypeptidase n=1 Tax=Hymenobacter coccineus TaxID=1908235 RepID=A0A1G1TLH6_9BACT|nr:M20 family peptidase [Hymenobacter coccineus]OGX91734.1 carboxypeptidase [Hymenobacter coccineus]
MRAFFRLLGLVLLVLTAVLVANTLRVPRHQLGPQPPPAPVAVPDSAVARLAAAVRIPTVSATDFAQTDTAQFGRFVVFLRQAFPRVHRVLTCQKFNTYGLLYEWKGRNPALPPLLLLAHYDVVPVPPGSEAQWQQPPFAGRVAGGYLYGRGTLDDKLNVLGQLEAIDYLLQSNFQPERTVLLAFGQDEETLGQRGAAAIADALQRRGVRPELILDEGGLVKTDGVAGLARPVALVGISEKGYLSLEISAVGAGGHSSMPPAHTSIGRVAAAVAKLEANPFPARLDGGVGALLDYLASEVPFGKRLVFANRWLFGPLVKRTLAATASGNAALRTTTAPTIFRAGTKDNVLPIGAAATVNFRILPGDSVAGVVRAVRRLIDDDQVQVRRLKKGNEPAPVSSTTSAAFGALHRTIGSVFPGALVAPYVLVGATDARAYAGLSANTYRFSPLPMAEADIQRLHGTNERIRVTDYERVIRFYVALIKNFQLQ